MYTVTLLASLLAAGPVPSSGRYFKITVVDEQTGRGDDGPGRQTAARMRIEDGQIARPERFLEIGCVRDHGVAEAI